MFEIKPVLIFVWILIGCLTAYVAERRGRDGKIWFVLGLFLGLLGFVLLLMLPQSLPEETPETQVNPEGPQHAYMGKEWFYLDEERNQTGPIAFRALFDAWKAQKIDDSSYLWTEGMERWFKLHELPDLQFSFSQYNEKYAPDPRS